METTRKIEEKLERIEKEISVIKDLVIKTLNTSKKNEITLKVIKQKIDLIDRRVKNLT